MRARAICRTSATSVVESRGSARNSRLPSDTSAAPCTRGKIRRSSDLALLVSALETRDTWHRLLLLEEPTTARRELLATLFRVVVAPGNGVRLLAREDLVEVLAAEHPE